MIKKILLALVALVLVGLAGLWFIGSGTLGEDWQSSPAVAGPRPESEPAGKSDEVLFGDLHVHTSHSIDAALFGLPMVTGASVMMPSDACDFARYCSALDFWSINDHAEGMTPRSWQDSVQAIRDCNAQAGDPNSPDMVSLVGWEWSQGNGEGTHYGHKNVIFREWEEGRTPERPISSEEVYMIAKMIPAPVRALLALNAEEGEFGEYQDYSRYAAASVTVPRCRDDVSSDQLPADCREVAENPTDLYRKLDELGYDSVVIPHGLAWGRTNPRDADFAKQLPEHNPKYQTLIETYSGHGNSEVFADFERRIANADGSYSCPEPSDDFMPCCQRAGELIRERCEDPTSAACEQRVSDARRYAVELLDDRSRAVVSGATIEEWGNCGQLLNDFLPAWYYVPTQSTQYNLAVGDFSEKGRPKHARMGIMASSDGHKARPGSSYKQQDRTYTTDTKDVGKSGTGLSSALGASSSTERGPEPVRVIDQSFIASLGLPDRLGSFYYTGGLIGVHSAGRDRDSLWEGIDNKQVYGTSGERMMLWFDLLNGPQGETPMGSEVWQQKAPKFRVRALGAFKQKEGCPDYSRDALGEDRIADLCRGECYNPIDERKAITRIEVVRIRPQLSPEENIAQLIDDNWKVFDCPADGSGCEIEFEDEEFTSAGRQTLYYARAIQEAQPTINGDNYRCDYNEAGECIKINFCNGTETQADEACLGMAEPRAWSSPIWLDFAGE
jgi:hypothetical protein